MVLMRQTLGSSHFVVESLVGAGRREIGERERVVGKGYETR